MILGKTSGVWFTTVDEPLYDDWIPLRGRRSLDLYVERSEIDGSHMDVSGNWALFLQGRKSSRFGGELLYMEDDPGQNLLFENAFNSTGDLKMKFRITGDVGDNEYVGQAFVRELSPSGSDENPSELSIEIRIPGELEVLVPAWLTMTDVDTDMDVGDSMDDMGDEDSDGLAFYTLLFGEPNA